ncbi:GNAT family N-acetyltransferase [Marinomonas pollencensis]|uniref:tRNA(Met) cytidine acetyltransferase TmcA n=1 Tax=Marinomonas pollencensis TaxID=491954 RepID=A0A3E0DPV1_9GAMM|nr:GNAT family N-acetyltransferase [Marinomonas pollencensis]REG84960.1 tRNA(Met)-cytidine N(4)-acetyltransferase [Marinomonas pollencensis]
MHSSDNHRHCFLFIGSEAEVLSDFLRLCEHLAEPLICAHEVTQYQHLTRDTSPSYRTCSFKQARQELGASHEAILVDLRHGVSASALAILAGTVRGNGVFAIALPKGDWQSMTDQDLPRYLPWPYQSAQIDSSFKRFLLTRLLAPNSPFRLTHCGSKEVALQALPALSSDLDHPPLNTQQALAQSCLLALEAKSYVLLAPRGRGKSTLLGDSLAKLLETGKKVALVAANQSAVVTLKQRFEAVLSISSASLTLPFFAPDALLSNSNHWDILLVDEAATIPIPMLKALNDKADHCLFSSTDYGYEGAGKGFGIQFCRYLAKQVSPRLKPLEQLHLTQPIRWGENDPLENWLNKSFFLATSEAPEIKPSNAAESCEYLTITGAQWLTQETLLADTFQLLVSAHYQTSADNLRWVLDDPSVTCHLLGQDTAVTSVAIITEEGTLPDTLSLAVMQGTRRPRGHLIPQSLLAHEGWENAGDYRYWRISRIATQTAQQNNGYASRLLQQIESSAKAPSNRCDFLCTSFAATSEVVAFWLKNGFIPVRLGTTKDQASGCYSLMMVKPLTHQAEQQARLWQQGYLANLSINLPRDYADIDASLANQLNRSYLDKALQNSLEIAPMISTKDRKDLALFAYHHRPYLTIRAQLTRMVNSQIACHQLTTAHPDYPLLHAVINQAAHQIDFSVFHLKTKKQVERRLKSAVDGLLSSSQ